MAALPVGDAWQKGNEEDVSILHNCFCPSCGKSNGVTTMLPTRVPMFREIILMNLNCEDCGFRNAEVNFGGEIQEKGEKLTLTVNSSDDLNRQLIKSDSASLYIPRLDFEIPPTTQRGTVSTLEGVLQRAAKNLEELQPERLRLGDVDNFHRCKRVVEELRRFSGEACADSDDDSGEVEKQESVFPFAIVLDDPAGNSFIENPRAPHHDPHTKSEKYFRTPTQDMALGLQPSQQAVEEGVINDANPEHKNIANAPQGSHTIERDHLGVGRQEAIKFTTTCPHCHCPTETDMCMTEIPHFKEIIIMSMFCESCGFRSNEIKGGGAIPKYGTTITLRVKTPDDLAREVLKSDTAGIAIPEIDLELAEGGLDGLYTTVEGLLQKMRDRLTKANPFGSGDSAIKQHLTNDGGEFSGLSPNQKRYMAFLQKLKDLADGIVLPFTLVISDPLSNSFVGPVRQDAIALSLQAEKDGNNQCYEAYVDDGMEVDEYERTHDQNEILGLNDMKTENYQTSIGEDSKEYYGTDAMEDEPDRIRRLDVRGPDHPHEVGKAPVEGDVTIMGTKSVNYAVPSMGKRGKAAVPIDITQAKVPRPVDDESRLRKMIHDSEYKDDSFIMNEGYDKVVEGMVFKDGAQGLGYYTDKPLLKLWEESSER